jgi:PAS domain S-box-containing protein
MGSPAFWLGLLLGGGVSAAVVAVWQSRKNRQRRERARSSGALYANAISSSISSALLVFNVRGQLVWGGGNAPGIFGLPIDELPRRTLADLLPTFAADAFAHDMEAWLREHGIHGKVPAWETEGRRADGTRFPCELAIGQDDLPGGRVYTAVVRDVTDRAWAQEQLLLRESALDSALDGVTIVSLEFPGHPVVYANRAYSAVSGCEADDVLGRSSSLLSGPELDAGAREDIQSTMAQGASLQTTLRSRRQDGGVFWDEVRLSPITRADGEVRHYVAVHTDISDRISREQMLNERTAQLDAVFELSPDGFVAFDESDRVRIVNPAFERMTGLGASELLGQTRADFDARLEAICGRRERLPAGALSPASEPAAAVEALSAAVSEALHAAEHTEAPDDSAGELLHLTAPAHRILLRQVRHGAQRSVGTVMYFRDMTRELEVDRMKSEFLSMAAHELRTPMASIFGFTELLLRRSFDEARRRDMLATIHRQASLLVNLVNELLDLARIEARQGQDFQRRVQALAPIIESVLAGILVHGDPRRVQVELPDEAVLVHVDDAKLSLALTNVISNAYKYSPQDRPIRLSLSSRLHRDRPEVGLCVRDEGIGMTPAQLARLFERFFRADTSGNIPGTGLGMCIAKEIVELHGGVIEVQSAFGEGTQVTLWLPQASERLALPTAPPLLPSEPALP